ncbi:hypothetical protein LJC20_00470 [Eubacteriales bacterium OttesenSCG-928-M02]|nr:hypothetical protein [Eubacteriales bacterium OttesenSCG-928-M02]
MNLNELLAKYLEEDKAKAFLQEMTENKIFTSKEENLDTRYGKLQESFEAKEQEYATLMQELEGLKAGQGETQEAQEKLAEYETQIAALTEENETLKLDSAVRVELLSNKAKSGDIDYLMFKIKQDGELSFDEKGDLKGLDIEKLKTQYPGNFEESSKREVEVNLLPDQTKQNRVTKEQFDRMNYMDRVKLQKDDPDLYNELKKE